MKRLFGVFTLACALGFAGLATAQEKKDATPSPAVMAAPADAKPAEAAPTAATAPAVIAAAPAAASPKPNKGDTTWLSISTILVILMTIPGLALFYAGLVRSKNVLSVLMQVFVTFSVIALLWAAYGYSVAFTGGNAFFGGFSKAFLSGITPDSVGATFSKGVVIPEFSFVAFQLTFACITPALIVGAFAERMKFSAMLLFIIIWFTFAYLPAAHMVWYWDGPDAITDQKSLTAVTAAAGWLWAKGALDFAGGTVVHINAGVAALVAAYMVGKRTGYGREAITPHNLTMTYIGACLLWVGWFGFNAGSNLESNGITALVILNTILATAAAVVAWVLTEWILKGKPSVLGAASGAVAGLVAITPACGFVGAMGAIVIGLVSGVVCLWGVTGLKRMLKADDSLDVFGIHGLGGIAGAILTGVFAAPSLGGSGIYDYIADKASADYSIASQVMVQATGVLTTVVWSAVVAVIALFIVKMVIGLRVPEEAEREGLDITSHGESAYN